MKPVTARHSLAVWTLVLMSMRLAVGQRTPESALNSAEGADQFRLRAETNLVVIEATVRDEDGGIVNDLTRSAFHVFEDGVEQQISYFSRDELPLAVALVVDSSGSMDPVLRQLRRVAYDTLSLLKPDDRVALFDFAARAELLEGLTKDRRRIVNALSAIQVGGGTVVPDALYEAAAYLAHAAPSERHAVLLLSDNENTLKGYVTEPRLIRQALEAEAVIYSVRIREGLHPHMMPVLLPIYRDVSVEKIARETGGEVIDARSIKDVGPSMATAISRLRQRYSLGYYSTNHRHDGAFREVQIRVDAGANGPHHKYTVYARRGYYARPQDAGSFSTLR